MGIFALPKKAEAVWPMTVSVDLWDLAQKTILSVLKPVILTMVRQFALSLMSGQSDKPLFLSDPSSFLATALDGVAGQVINEIFGGNLCNHISLNIKLALIDMYLDIPSFECSLSEIVENFDQGGFIDLNNLADMGDPNNNDFGVFLTVQDRINSEQAEFETNLLNELEWGGGFLGQKECHKEIDPKTGKEKEVCRTTTPGTVIRDMVLNTQNSALNSASGAQDPLSFSSIVAESIVAFTDTLVQQGLYRILSEASKQINKNKD